VKLDGAGISRAGKDVLDDWLTQLADARTQAKVATRINRLAAGNFGDCKSLRQGSVTDEPTVVGMYTDCL
jgi:putative addiction module killer protein